MKSLRYFLIAALALAVTVSGCEITDINENPLAATSADPETVYPFVIVTLASNRTVENVQMQFHAQTWASSGAAGVFNDPEQYVISQFTTGNAYFAYYVTVIGNLQRILEDAEADNQNNVAAQSKLLQAFTFWMLTTEFEEIPFSQASNPSEFPFPEFDDQEDVLTGIVDLVDEAVAQIQPDSPIGGIENGDLIYEGDMNRWRRFGLSLKLRALMYLESGGSITFNDPAFDDVLGADFIRGNGATAYIPFGADPGNENNLFQLNDDFAGGVNAWFDASEALVDLMNANADPRRVVYFDDPSGAEDPNSNTFIGQPPGGLGSVGASIIDENWFDATTPARLITAAEGWLHEAEAYLGRGNTSAARASLEEGIRRSMGWFSTPGTGYEGESIAQGDIDAYVANRLVAFDAANNARKLEIIQEEQYINFFEMGEEAWATQRRTGVPALDAPQGSILGTGNIISRYVYPPDAVSANPNTPSQRPLDDPMFFQGG